MAAPVVRQASLQTASKAWVPGILTFEPDCGSWAPTDATAGLPLAFAFADVQGTLQKAKAKLRVPLPSGARVFALASEADVDAVVSVFKAYDEAVREGAAAAAAPGGGAGGDADAALSGQTGALSAGPPSGPPADPAAARAAAAAVEDVKAALLGPPPKKGERPRADLRYVRDALVSAGAVSEAEFWAARRDDLRAQARLGPGGRPQRPGLSSALVAEAPPTDAVGRKATFTLTPEVVHQVFAEKPWVRDAYDAKPPAWTDAEFWAAFLKYQGRAQKRRRARAAGLDPDVAIGPEEELFRAARAAARRGATAGRDDASRVAAARGTDATLNLAADEADGLGPGFGVAHGTSTEPAYLLRTGGCEPDLVHDLNRHGGVVVAGLPPALPLEPGAAVAYLRSRDKDGDACRPPDAEAADAAAAARAHAGGASGLDDLRADEAVAFEALTITDPRAYFGVGSRPRGGDGDNDGGAATFGNTDHGDLAALVGKLRAAATASDAAPDAPPVAPADAARVLADLASDGGEPGDGLLPPGADAGVALLPQLRGMARDAVLPVNEALRFFWAAQPASTPGRRDKTQRLAAFLKAAAVRVQALQEAGTGSERTLLARLLQPTADAINVALLKAQEVAG